MMTRADLAALAATPLTNIPRATLEAVAKEAIETLVGVVAIDQTPIYDYPGYSDYGRCVLNRYGEPPTPGARWNTPREAVVVACSHIATMLMRPHEHGRG